MIDTLITSRTRIKLLTRLFLNPSLTGHLRGLAEEFDESTNAIRLELNRFEDAGLLVGEMEGKRKVFHANIKHPFYNAILSLLKSHHGIDVIVESVINRLGNVEKVCAIGALAEGREDGTLELVLVGSDIDASYLANLISKAEVLLGRKIEFTVVSNYMNNKSLLLWEG